MWILDTGHVWKEYFGMTNILGGNPLGRWKPLIDIFQHSAFSWAIGSDGPKT